MSRSSVDQSRMLELPTKTTAPGARRRLAVAGLEGRDRVLEEGEVLAAPRVPAQPGVARGGRERGERQGGEEDASDHESPQAEPRPAPRPEP